SPSSCSGSSGDSGAAFATGAPTRSVSPSDAAATPLTRRSLARRLGNNKVSPFFCAALHRTTGLTRGSEISNIRRQTSDDANRGRARDPDGRGWAFFARSGGLFHAFFEARRRAPVADCHLVVHH